MKSKDIIQNIKNKINKENIKDIIFFFIISIIFFGIFINMEYATDTYTVFSVGAKQDIIHFLGSGRFVTAFFTLIARILNLGETSIYLISYIMAIISLVLSLYEMKKIISKDIKSNIMSRIISVFIVMNVFIIELFLFIEKGVLILSILFNVYAVKYLIKYFETKNKKELLKVLLFMFLANGSYQGTVGLFIAISLVYIIKYSKNIKEFFINNIITAVAYIISAVVDLGIAKIFAGDRVSGNIILSESISKVLSSTKNMLQSFDILPKNVFCYSVIFIIAIILIEILTNKEKIKENNKKKNLVGKVIQILEVCYIVLGIYLVTILPQLMQNTASIWVVPRSTYTFASLLGILMLYLFINFKDNIIKNCGKEEQEKKSSIAKVINLKNIIIAFSMIFIFIQYYNFQKIEMDRYELNEEDKNISLQIIESIKQYEAETENTVINIAIYNDKNIKYSYKDIKVIGDLNVRAYSADWATKSILEYYAKKQFNVVQKNEKIEEYFKNKNWDFYNEEQLVFNDNTLHLCCY